MRNKTVSEVEKIHGKILKLQVAGSVAKSVLWVALTWLAVECLLHVHHHGLKHLIDIIWLGSAS